MMFIIGHMQNQFDQFYDCIESRSHSFNQGLGEKIDSFQNFISHEKDVVCQKLTQTLLKTREFIRENMKTIFFIGCCCTTAYFNPNLFLIGAIITIVCRIEFTRHLKNFMNQHWKDSSNPFKNNPWYGPSYLSNIDVTFGAIAAIDAIALGTIFYAKTCVVRLMPALGGVAAGNCIAKWVMDMSKTLS